MGIPPMKNWFRPTVDARQADDTSLLESHSKSPYEQNFVPGRGRELWSMEAPKSAKNTGKALYSGLFAAFFSELSKYRSCSLIPYTISKWVCMYAK